MPSVEALQYSDEQAFVDSLQSALASQLEAGQRTITLDLTGVVELPPSFIPALRTAVQICGDLGTQVLYRCSPQLAPQLAAESLPHEAVVDRTDERLPLIETVTEFEFGDGWIVAREPDESAVVADFEFWFDEVAARGEPEIRIDLRPRRYLSPTLAHALVTRATRASRQGQQVRIRVTSAQELALAQISGSSAILLDREPVINRQTEVMRTIDRATQSIHEAFSEAMTSGGGGRNRRVDARLAIRNAYVIYQPENEGDRRRTRLLDISRGGLGFFSSTPLELDRILKLHLQLPAFLNPERVVGKIASCALVELDDGSRAYRVGVSYAAQISTLLDARLRLLERTDA